MYASNSHSYTHLLLALGIVIKPTVWVLNFITSEYPGIHDIGLPLNMMGHGSHAMMQCRLVRSVGCRTVWYAQSDPVAEFIWRLWRIAQCPRGRSTLPKAPVGGGDGGGEGGGVEEIVFDQPSQIECCYAVVGAAHSSILERLHSL